MKKTSLLALGLLIIASNAISFQPFDKIEGEAMLRLARVKANTRTPTQDFTSDGCSGGMSEGWKLTATLLPGFEAKFGDVPPWESCCVKHDRVYWKGITDNGYEIRLIADEQLRECVIQTGATMAQGLGIKLGVSKKTVEEVFEAAAKSMYTAVRVGGGPCTGLPWRWGYGWPKCGK